MLLIVQKSVVSTKVTDDGDEDVVQNDIERQRLLGNEDDVGE